MDDDRPRVSRNRFSRPSGRYKGTPSIFTAEYIGGTCSMARGIVLRLHGSRLRVKSSVEWRVKNGAGGIQRIGGFAQAKHGMIFLIPFNKIFSNAGAPPDQHRQHSRCGRIQGAGMTNLDSAEKMPHFATTSWEVHPASFFIVSTPSTTAQLCATSIITSPILRTRLLFGAARRSASAFA